MMFNRVLMAMVMLWGWMGVAMAASPDWRPYETLLKKYVTPGEKKGVKLNLVNYTALKNDPLLGQSLAVIESYPVEQLQTNDEKIAFYANAYNILAMKVMVDNWPVESIRDIGGVFRPVWKMKVGTLGNKKVTLDDVENELLRPLGELRIHFAIVCASVSCPDLRMEPYTAEQLNKQLDDQVQQFIHNEGKGLKLEGSVVHVSKIFSWFGQDFEKTGGIEPFIKKNHPLPADSSIDPDIYYDWSVNGS